MPLPSAGRDVTLYRNAMNGRFDLQWDATGNPAFGDDGSHMVLSLLMEHRGLWWFDETGERGSTFFQIKHDVRSTASDIKSAADLALSPALVDGRLLRADTSVTKEKPGSYTLFVNWQTPNGATGYVPLTIGY